MTGKGHLISGSIMLADTYMLHSYMLHNDVSANFLLSIQNFIEPKLNMFEIYKAPINTVMFFASIIIFYFGLLFPDLDLDSSTVSKLMHFSIPIKHRGFLHSIWVVLLVGVIGIWFFPFRYFMLGILCHDIIDSFSVAGWVPLYPIGRYKTFNNSIVAIRKKGFGFYKSGEISEVIILIILGVLSGFLFYLVKFM